MSMRAVNLVAFKLNGDSVAIYDNAECYGEPDLVIAVWIIRQIAASLEWGGLRGEFDLIDQGAG